MISRLMVDLELRRSLNGSDVRMLCLFYGWPTNPAQWIQIKHKKIFPMAELSTARHGSSLAPSRL